VIGNEEWEYFKSNVTKYQGSRDGYEADNYSSVRWSDFASAWNKWVDSLGTRSPTITYKTSAYLKDAYKSMRRQAVQSSTLRPYKQTLEQLHERHNNHDMDRTFAKNFPPAKPAAPIRPAAEQPLAQQEQNDEYPADLSNDGDLSPTQRNRTKKKKQKKQNSKSRCRRCGKFYSLPEWQPYHVNKIVSIEDWKGKRASSRYLRNGPGNKVWKNCTVDPDDFEEKYPLKEGQRHPEAPRKKSRTR
jgi:hypothetical protein